MILIELMYSWREHKKTGFKPVRNFYFTDGVLFPSIFRLLLLMTYFFRTGSVFLDKGSMLAELPRLFAGDVLFEQEVKVTDETTIIAIKNLKNTFIFSSRFWVQNEAVNVGIFDK